VVIEYFLCWDRMPLTEKDQPNLSVEHAALAGLSAALTWECAREKAADPIQ
jgi:hypothetical protein